MEENQSLDELRRIRQMMERSSRFISLSGLSGVAAGMCALTGAFIAHSYVTGRRDFRIDPAVTIDSASLFQVLLNNRIFWIAMGTLAGALVSAFVFTWWRSKKQGIPVWGVTTRRLLISISIPLAAGAVFLYKLIEVGSTGLVAAGCLIFYGLALVNASRYTLAEIRYLGYCELLLGLAALFFTGYGIYFWSAGFGILHILYGWLMWHRYERATTADN